VTSEQQPLAAGAHASLSDRWACRQRTGIAGRQSL